MRLGRVQASDQHEGPHLVTDPGGCLPLPCRNGQIRTGVLLDPNQARGLLRYVPLWCSHDSPRAAVCQGPGPGIALTRRACLRSGKLLKLRHLVQQPVQSV